MYVQFTYLFLAEIAPLSYPGRQQNRQILPSIGNKNDLEGGIASCLCLLTVLAKTT